MSKEALAKVVQRAISDAGFRRQLSTDPAGALRGFSLSPDEAAAIRSGDAGRLSALGIDQRMSKVYALGTSAASNSAISDVSGGGPNLISNGNDAGVLGSVDSDVANASQSALVTGDTTSDGNLIDAGTTGGGPAIIPVSPQETFSADDPGDMNTLVAADAGGSTTSTPSTTSYSGDDIAGPGYGADAGGGVTPTVEQGDGPQITP